MLYGQDSVAVGLTNGERRVAAYIGGTLDEVINKLSEIFGENVTFMQEEDLQAMESYMQ